MEDLTKKRKLNPEATNMDKAVVEESKIDHRVHIVFVIFKNLEGTQLGTELEMPLNSSVEELTEAINQLLENEERMLYSFSFDNIEIQKSLKETLKKLNKITTETRIPITYHPESLFMVRPITRQSSSLEGHSESVLHVAFSPDSKSLASASGDTTVRIWDINTETPMYTCEGHKNWVLIVAWSPNAQLLASGSMDNTIRLWDPKTGKQIGNHLKGHNKWITSLSWEPLHSRATPKYLASSSKDATVKIWNVLNQTLEASLTSHTSSVTKVLWGGQGLIYSSSEDRTIKVWKSDGTFVTDLKGHGHWVNSLCLHTDYALRTGCFSEKAIETEDPEEMSKLALERYNKLKGNTNERLVSCSDDHTLYMWDPVKKSEPVIRLTGHQQPVNHAAFSPDGKYLVSASFDKSLRLWDGFSGKFITVLRGHVGAVYQVAWSIDSRLFVSGSKDSTLKVWTMKTRKMMFDLPGHADEVYSVDWSPDGERVVSGGKDRLVKIWRN